MSFDRIKGQETAVARLRRSIALGRVASAYLFCGPPGVGKKAVALAFAEALLCERGGDSGCGTCRSCLAAARESHPDIHLWERPKDKKSFPIDTVREIIASLSLRPYWGRAMVTVINGADTMTPEAANAFLLTLEEPPPKSVLILIAANRQLLPETVVSRCQTIFFRPLTEETVAGFLESAGAGREEAWEAARAAEGSLTAAESLVGEPWRKTCGAAEDLFSKWAEGGAPSLLHPLVSACGSRDEAERALTALRTLLRRSLRRSLGLPAGTTEDDRSAAGRLARIGLRDYICAFEALQRAALLLKGNVNPRLVAEGLFLELDGCLGVARSPEAAHGRGA